LLSHDQIIMFEAR